MAADIKGLDRFIYSSGTTEDTALYWEAFLGYLSKRMEFKLLVTKTLRSGGFRELVAEFNRSAEAVRSDDLAACLNNIGSDDFPAIDSLRTYKIFNGELPDWEVVLDSLTNKGHLEATLKLVLIRVPEFSVGSTIRIQLT